MGGVPAIEAKALRYSVRGRVILDGIDLAVPRGKSIAIMGPSGTGKTTLLMCLAGIFPIESGKVWINGSDVTGLKPAARAALRLRHVGVVYQFGELLPELTPIENVVLPALLRGERRRAAYDRANGLLNDLAVGTLAVASTHTLSGGERQRVAVARALITEPTIVLADEPTGSLDRSGAEAVSDLLFELPRRYACALIVVTHNDQVAVRADSVMSLGSASGKLAVAGS